MSELTGWGHPDRDALLYFEVASERFEEAETAELAGDNGAAVASIKAGLRTLATALLCCTTVKGRGIIEEAIEFWSDTLAELSAA